MPTISSKKHFQNRPNSTLQNLSR